MIIYRFCVSFSFSYFLFELYSLSYDWSYPNLFYPKKSRNECVVYVGWMPFSSSTLCPICFAFVVLRWIFFVFCFQQPEALKLKEEISRIKSKIKSSKKELERKKEEQKRHVKEIHKLQKDLHDITDSMRELNEKGQDGAGKLQLGGSQLKEYHRM